MSRKTYLDGPLKRKYILRELKTKPTLDKIFKFMTNLIQHAKTQTSETIKKLKTTWTKAPGKTLENTKG
jgi:hypothetical protein